MKQLRAMTNLAVIFSALTAVYVGCASKAFAYPFPSSGFMLCKFSAHPKYLTVYIVIKQYEVVGGFAEFLDLANGGGPRDLGRVTGYVSPLVSASHVDFPEVNAREVWGDPVDEAYAVNFKVISGAFLPPGSPGRCEWMG
jgi:hypothetical protein